MLCAGAARADSPAQGLLDRPFVIQAGGFNLTSGIKANVNGQSTQNPEVDFDNAFGKDKAVTRARIDALWRVSERHHLRAQYFNNKTKRTQVLKENVPFGEYVFQTGTSATLQDRSEIWQVAYEYAFLRNPQLELSAMLGVHVADIAMQVSGNANKVDASGNVINTGFATRSADALAPMPVVGLRAAWAASPNWYLEGQAQLFALKSNNYKGTWANLRVGATWMFNHHFGVGLGYDIFGTRLDVDKSNFDGRVKLGYRGVQAYITGTF